MAFVYQLTFDIPTSQENELLVGNSIEESVAYLRALLPNEPGYIMSRGMYSLTHEDKTHIVMESTWEDWDSLIWHRQNSQLDEQKMLNHFQLKVKLENLATHVFKEIGS